jgi:enoyl-CoA hydratase/carnithine racemase
MTELVLYQVTDGIAELTLNRPDKRNAITSAMYESLGHHLREAELDAEVRVLLLQGGGGTFTAGNDLRDFLDDPPSGPDTPVARFLHALATARKPLIAAVDGWVVGIGVTLLLHCDLVVAGEGALFQTPFVDLGLVPEAASSLLLPRMVGHHKAAEILLLGERFTAADALAWGLVNRVVGTSELRTVALGWATSLAAKPPGALQLTKDLLRSPRHQVVDRIAEETEMFTRQLASPEAIGAFEAFFDRSR